MTLPKLVLPPDTDPKEVFALLQRILVALHIAEIGGVTLVGSPNRAEVLLKIDTLIGPDELAHGTAFLHAWNSPENADIVLPAVAALSEAALRLITRLEERTGGVVITAPGGEG